MNRKEWVNFQRQMYVFGHEWRETERSISQGRFLWTEKRLGSPPAKVLDMGCNDGTFSKRLAEKGFQVTAMDFPEAIEKIEDKPSLQLGGNPLFLSVELDDLVFYAGPRALMWFQKFDVVLLLEVLEHVIYDFDLLTWCRVALKPGGRLFVTVPATDNNVLPTDHHLRYYTKNALNKLLHVTEFKPVLWHSDAHSLMVEAKK